MFPDNPCFWGATSHALRLYVKKTPGRSCVFARCASWFRCARRIFRGGETPGAFL
jgi:hypothetical protein